ncbi:MAG: hypothetical protein K0R38_6293 [Polyangiaceae bacterium]|jgi:hypothetical protein|nr:hypothetical protein [Polyangiaceae bacterium]
MLRVEPSNLPHPRAALRPRRLLAHPVGSQRPGASKARHEMLPPREDQRASSDELTVPHSPQPNERWSVRLELGDADIAKLYGQGMTRGAVVWRKGMMEWRPLLVTPELTGMLRHTRTTLTPELPPLPSWVDAAPTLPKPPRVPTSTIPPALQSLAVTPTTVAPMAMDVEPPRRGRRPIELVAVAVAAFAVAWIAHGVLKKKPSEPSAMLGSPSATLAAAAAAPACEPPKAEASSSATPTSTIPTVSVADLPLAGARGNAIAASFSGAAVSRASSRAVSNSSSHNSGGAPSRSDLMNALNGVARAAGGCGDRGGPVRVVLSFANSGVARSIQVTGPELPAATRSCIIGAASRARIPAFTGDPVTVSKTL